MEDRTLTDKAVSIAKQYIHDHLKDTEAVPTIFVVWKVTVLQNYKCLIATTLPHGMYIELTYDGDEAEWYMDVYRKAENVVIPDG